MSAAFAVARQELRQHRLLLVGALVVGLMAMAVGYLPVANARSATESWALVLGNILSAAVAVALGASIIGRDLAERRLGFYLARPMSVGSLWAGKQLAAIVVVLAVWVLVVAPDWISSGYFVFLLSGRRGNQYGALIIMLSLVLLTVASHAVASVFRSRSALVLLDLSLAAAVLLAGRAILLRLVAAGAPAAMPQALHWLYVGAIAAIMAASAAQLCVGRGDLRRGHLALSATLWPMVAAVILGFHVWVGSIVGVTPQQAGGAVRTSGDDRTVYFRGFQRDFKEDFDGSLPMFALDVRSGRWISMPPGSQPGIAAEGDVAAWIAEDELEWLPPALVVVRSTPGQAPSASRLEIADLGQGARVLAVGRGEAVVTDGTIVRRVRLDDASERSRVAVPDVARAVWMADDRVRLVRLPASGGAVVLDWTSGQEPIERSRLQAGAPTRVIAADTRYALFALPSRRKALLDVDTSQSRVFALPERSPDGPGALLAGGRLAHATGGELRIEGLGPQPPVVVPLPNGVRMGMPQVLKDGSLAVTTWSTSFEGRGTLVIDPDSGAVRRELKGLTPAGSSGNVFVDEDGSIFEVTSAGERRVVLSMGGRP